MLSEKRKINVRVEIRLYHIHSEHHIVIWYFINTTSPGSPRLTLAERALQIAILNCSGQQQGFYLYHFLFLNLVYGRDTLHSALMAVGAASFQQHINMFFLCLCGTFPLRWLELWNIQLVIKGFERFNVSSICNWDRFYTSKNIFSIKKEVASMTTLPL